LKPFCDEPKKAHLLPSSQKRISGMKLAMATAEKSNNSSISSGKVRPEKLPVPE
jgi:hypothetical protein